MYLWLISQDANNDYDTYDSAVVVAADAESARRVHPNQFRTWIDDELYFQFSDGTSEREASNDSWCGLEAIKVERIGVAATELVAGQVVCASFNAG